MALTEDIQLESVEVLEDCTLIAKEVTRILRDGLQVARADRRWALMPGDSLEGQPARVVAMAETLWTPDVIRARMAAMQLNPAGPSAVDQ